MAWAGRLVAVLCIISLDMIARNSLEKYGDEGIVLLAFLGQIFIAIAIAVGIFCEYKGKR